uniref:VTT domain-containing protein n=1 Tax=Odontella aurita TaxID=265563 RepID=A0A7S4JVV3_9STRA
MAHASEARSALRRSRIKKLVLALVLIGFIVFVIIDSTTNGYIKDGIQTFLRWIEENPIEGFFMFMGVYVLATVLFVPGLILTLGAGYVFSNAFGTGLGLFVGTISVFVGASLGSMLAFLISRYILREWAVGLTEKFPIFRAIDQALEEKGLKIIILLRLSPVIPFNALNYVCGVTAVSFKDYSLALFAMLPGTILYVFLGASAQSLATIGSSTDSKALTISTVVVGVVLGIVAVALSSRYAKKELNKILDQEEEANERIAGGEGEGGKSQDRDNFVHDAA